MGFIFVRIHYLVLNPATEFIPPQNVSSLEKNEKKAPSASR